MSSIHAAMFLSTIGLFGVIQSDHIDAWAKLTAVPILGGVVTGLMYLNHRQQRHHVEAIDQMVQSFDRQFEGIREDNREHLQKQNELLREILQERD